MLAAPLFLRCAKVRQALVFKGKKAHLFQVRKIDPPTTPKVPVEPVSKEVAQHLLRVIFRSKLQCWINRLVPEWQIQEFKHRMTELVVREPN